MPPQGIPLVPHAELLSYEEILAVVRAAVELNITKVRLTGGEPLVRSKLVDLVKMLSNIKGIDDLSLTTNGVLLRYYAPALKKAGLKRVNVSLDSLQKDRFHYITGYDGLAEVMKGIEAAHNVGLEPVKINMVVMRGINDGELVDFAHLTQEGWHVRFIELMPSQFAVQFFNLSFMSAYEVKQQLTSLGSLEPYLSSNGNGPAKYYRLPGVKGTIGFITPVSEHFCFSCNRLRLTSQGGLLPCLLSDEQIDVKQPLRRGASPDELKQLLKQAVASKPPGHQLAQGVIPQRRSMSQVGG
jgi:cyclic pyranopterin phosphate synthase